MNARYPGNPDQSARPIRLRSILWKPGATARDRERCGGRRLIPRKDEQ